MNAMNAALNVVVYWVGVVTCLAGGVALASLVTITAIDQVRALWKRVRA